MTQTRYRLPDVCVTLRRPTAQKALLEAAFLAIEILSDDDRMTRVLEKLKEYAANGTPHIWVIDPRLRQMFTFRANALQEVESNVIATDDPRLELTREEAFQE